MNKAYPHPKPLKKRKKRRKTDEAYIDFIRSKYCLICYRNAEAHHEPIKKSSGVAMKGSDRETIPLCREHHSERHNTGKLTFYRKYEINYAQEIKELQAEYDKRKNKRRNAMRK